MTDYETADPRKLRLVFAGSVMALTLAALDQNIVATAPPRITGDLGGFQKFSCVIIASILTRARDHATNGRGGDGPPLVLWRTERRCEAA